MGSFSLKRTLPNADHLNPVAQVICQHGHGICSVIVDILHGETEAGQLVHGLAVIVIPAAVFPEIEVPDRGCMLLNSRQFRHIRRSFFVRHVDAVLMLIPEDTVYIVAVFVPTVIGFSTPHFNLVLQDLRHHTGLGAALIPSVKNPVMDEPVQAE